MRRSAMDERLAARLRAENAMPHEARDRISSLLESLPERVRPPRKRWRERSLPQTAIASALLIVAGAAFWLASYDSVKTTTNSLYSVTGGAGGQDASISTSSGSAGQLLPAAEHADKGYTLRVHDIAYDGLHLTFNYTLEHVDGIPADLWVSPEFMMDPALKEAYPGVTMANSGGAEGDRKSGTVHYFFMGKAPESFRLKLQVGKLSVFTDPANQQTFSGDWSLTIPVARTGSVVDIALASPVTAEKGAHLYSVQRARLADNSAQWSIYNEFPNSEQSNELDEDAPRSSVHYEVWADGRKLEILTTTGSSSSANPKYPVRKVTTVLVTEPVPKGAKTVSVMPVRRTGVKTGKLWSYTEEPLQDYELRIPLP